MQGSEPFHPFANLSFRFAPYRRYVNRQSQPYIEAHYPATFRNRGVAVPFTTPLLVGTRIRECGRAGIELLVPNPSGGRGVYILHWSAVQDRYRPTVHDAMLLQRLAGHGLMDPRIVRATGWDIAREGFAGQEARAAAEAASTADRSERMLAEYHLLHALVEQVEPRGQKPVTMADASAALALRSSEVLHRLALSFNSTGPQLGTTLAVLAQVFAPVGVTTDDPRSRVARMIGGLQDTLDDMTKSLLISEESDGIRLGWSVTASMNTALTCARALLQASRVLLADPLNLLKHWIRAPAQVRALAMRTEWALDGWELISLLWQTAKNNVARRGALLEMAQLVPVLPHEAMDWTQSVLAAEALDPACRVICQTDGGRRGGAAFMQVGRNEMLRSLSL